MRDILSQIAAAALGTLTALAILSSGGCAGHSVQLRIPPSPVLTPDGLCYEAGVTVTTIVAYEGYQVQLSGDGSLRLCGAVPDVAP